MYYLHQPVYYYSPYAQIPYGNISNVYSVYPSHLYQTLNDSKGHINIPKPNKLTNIQNPYQNTPTTQRNTKNPFPPVDPDLLHQSANETKKLMEDASMVLEKLASSKNFDSELMNYAQQSNMEEVKRLIDSIGIQSDVKIQYNPDSLRLEFSSKHLVSDCCKLTIVLRWR